MVVLREPSLASCIEDADIQSALEYAQGSRSVRQAAAPYQHGNPGQAPDANQGVPDSGHSTSQQRPVMLSSLPSEKAVAAKEVLADFRGELRVCYFCDLHRVQLPAADGCWLSRGQAVDTRLVGMGKRRWQGA